MVTIERILESNEKLNFLTSEEKEILQKLDEISNKGQFVDEYNNFINEKITTSLKNIMIETVWETKYNETYITKNKEAKNFLGSFEKIQLNPDCVSIRVYFEF